MVFIDVSSLFISCQLRFLYFLYMFNNLLSVFSLFKSLNGTIMREYEGSLQHASRCSEMLMVLNSGGGQQQGLGERTALLHRDVCFESLYVRAEFRFMLQIWRSC